MTWQLASFAIVSLALVGAFGWYERSRPSARVLSLVAALAALAVVGRLAFVAFPNVKPTTDIVLLAGYALGGAAGFAVGAITPLASNVFLGHGPWTPWQMVGWGGVGIAGAVLAGIMRGRELGRWPLALACGVAGAAFGVVMDTYQWTLAAEQDAGTWLAVAGSSLPYNAAHVVGNIVFCLLIGPAFLRALSRYRRRFEVRWAPAAAGVAALALLAFPVSAFASAGDRAAGWLERAQNRDGGFGSAPGQASGALFTGWASLGIAAAGTNPRDVERRGRSPIDYTRRGVRAIRDVGELERTILVLEAAGVSPRRFGGSNLVARLKRYRRDDGSFSGYVSYTAFGILALRATGSRAVGRSARWLAKQRNDDGGFGVLPRAQSDVDNTAAVLQALGSAGRGDSRAARRAVRYLRGAQNDDGGFGQYEGRTSNVQSTAYAVQGLVATGRNPGRVRSAGRSPLAYIRSLQRRSGRVDYSRTSEQTPVWVTAQAAMALERRPLPLAAVPRERRRTATAQVAAPAERPRSDVAGEAPAETAAGARKRADGSSKRRARSSRREPRGGVARSVPTSNDGSVVEPVVTAGASEGRPGGSGPDWLGAALALASAAFAAWLGRRARGRVRARGRSGGRRTMVSEGAPAFGKKSFP